ncbi:unnamed protein product [Echinostoma caproni]|uniref:BPTI/Kunitz inhibitor domain-containing protein n=1 Tax=Echinostoma caproni TaxID=27848 RepID=A0A183AT46_9TREM|nr:unnamed protein product [Echinostoma caproni]
MIPCEPRICSTRNSPNTSTAPHVVRSSQFLANLISIKPTIPHLLTNLSYIFLRLSSDICNLRINPGPCLAIHYRWGWDNRRRQCIRFRYGGCGGNPNRFPSKLGCELACRYLWYENENYWENANKSFAWAYISGYYSPYLRQVQSFIMIIRLTNPLRKILRISYTSQALSPCHNRLNIFNFKFFNWRIAAQLILLLCNFRCCLVSHPTIQDLLTHFSHY